MVENTEVEKLDRMVSDEVSATVDEHCSMDNDGIGHYQYGADECYDKGTDFVDLDSYTIEIDVTDFSEELRAKVGDLDSITGDDFYEGTEFSWIARPRDEITEKDGRFYLEFEVECS